MNIKNTTKKELYQLLLDQQKETAKYSEALHEKCGEADKLRYELKELKQPSSCIAKHYTPQEAFDEALGLIRSQPASIQNEIMGDLIKHLLALKKKDAEQAKNQSEQSDSILRQFKVLADVEKYEKELV